ncbi:MGMT family protein [Streptomyces sp. PGLac3x]
MSQDTPPPAEPPALPPYAERVLDVAELIPPGRVMTYGDIAEWLEEGGPRQVGRVMALYGSAVPWWRVVRSDGALLPGHERRALAPNRAPGPPRGGPPAGRRPAPPRPAPRVARPASTCAAPAGTASPVTHLTPDARAVPPRAGPRETPPR